jgi:hypothetical protein
VHQAGTYCELKPDNQDIKLWTPYIVQKSNIVIGEFISIVIKKANKNLTV